MADALHWYLNQQGIRHIRHYLNDLIIIAPPRSDECSQSLEILRRVCNYLAVPIAEHKTVGPTTCLTFLGIEIDTTAGKLRLPEGKMSRLTSLLQSWDGRRMCTRRDLESLIGHLNHACKVVRPGRAFLRRMIELLHTPHCSPNSHTPIRLNADLRAYKAWWTTFLA